MRNTYGTKNENPALATEWRAYWAAMALGDVPEMQRAYSRIERLQRLDAARRSTLRMLAVVHAALPGK